VSTARRPSVYRHYFIGFVRRPAPPTSRFCFTLKYRTTESAWRWVSESSGLGDGEVCFQSATLPANLEDLLPDIHSSFEVRHASSDVPDTKIWDTALPVGSARDESVFNSESLGVPLHVTRWFALVRLWTPWLAPRHGSSSFGLAEDAILASFLRTDGLHLAVIAVSGIAHTLTVLQDDGKGGVCIKARNDDIEPVKAKIVVGVGYSFETALAACVYEARKMATGGFDINGQLADELEPTGDGERRLKRLRPPNDAPYKRTWRSTWLDGLTYCTWNALGQKLSEKKILDALDDLDKNNIKITNLIIDDNWQSLDNPGASQNARGWTDFEANEEGFPRGLLHCINEARDRHPSIDHVAVWHAMLGYWGAISPTGNIARKYKTTEIRKAHQGGATAEKLTVVAAEDVERLYDDFYHFLQSCRIDGVKTDAQFMLDLIHDAKDRRELIRKYQDAWTVSSLKWFSTRAISCMSQVPQIIFHSQLPQNRPSICVRNSDDFFPEIPSSHPWHIFTNAYTSLFTHHLNAIPDWDMFQTSHSYSSFHGAARCVSGGPVYITDTPGEHDLDLIAQMTAQDNRNNTIILRPSTVGRTTSSGVYTSYDEERFLKVSTFHGGKGTGSGVLGVFNTSSRALTELVMLHDFPGIEHDQEYVVRAHTTGEISVPMRLSHELPFVSVFLDIKAWEILTAYPLMKCGALSVAPLGLLGKMTGVAAIVGSSVELDEKGRVRVAVQLKALGIYGKF
jgi:Raffinose synthase or seed imbibition protein Sip1